MELKNEMKTDQERILLMTLPFLTPLIPPMGISCLKSFLQAKGYDVKTVDVMTHLEVKEICYRYFDKLQEFVPEEKQGHFFNIGLDVLFNHFMAHLNYKDELEYIRLVKLLVAKNFFVEIGDEEVLELNRIVKEFFTRLEEYLFQMFNREKPTVLGLSVYKGTLAASMFAGKLLKKMSPGVRVIMGGTIFSQELFPETPNFYRFLEKATFVDKIFIGESENLFLKYLKGQLTENKKVYTLKDINDQLLDLNTLALPDFSDFNLSSYPLLPSFTSRGCVYRCSFCAETVFWKRYNRKSAEKVADEFVQLYQIYGKQLFILTDCLINPIVNDLSNELIRRGFKVYWDVYLKVDENVCNQECTLLWRRGGFYRARLGIESGSQRVLDMIDKKITLEQIKSAIYSLASAGIKTTTYWIAGHPGETEADFQQTLDLLEDIQDCIFEAECDPFRYFYAGQVNAEEWQKEKGNNLLYPKEATDMLLAQTYTLNTYPSREIIYQRQCRFKEHCKKLGIPNPYSIGELMEADKRWKRLQKNAVPTVMELSTALGKYEGETIQVSRIFNAENTQKDNVGFNF